MDCCARGNTTSFAVKNNLDFMVICDSVYKQMEDEGIVNGIKQKATRIGRTGRNPVFT